jgi:hypothetical protein
VTLRALAGCRFQMTPNQFGSLSAGVLGSMGLEAPPQLDLTNAALLNALAANNHLLSGHQLGGHQLGGMGAMGAMGGMGGMGSMGNMAGMGAAMNRLPPDVHSYMQSSNPSFVQFDPRVRGPS